nr:nuclear pore complex protein Nup93 [Cryptococcus depauperatus CBS 7841]
MSTSRPPAATALSSLLAKANSLHETDYDSELPQIRFGIDDIERMSETIAGKGKRIKGEKGEAYNLLSNLGVNTSQLTHSISQLPFESSVTRPRKRRLAQSRAESQPDLAQYPPAEGDIASWGRNWHEMVILGGIELQRQKIINSFQNQFQNRIFQNWQLEKARILQEELCVTDEELSSIADAARTAANGLSGSALGQSAFGSSVRRFPMAVSSLGKSTTEAREGGLVMHSKMVRYEKIISELNAKRVAQEPYELCLSLMESTKNDHQQPLLWQSFNLLGQLVYEPSLRETVFTVSSENQPSVAEPIQERQYAAAYLDDYKSHNAVMLRGRLISGGLKYLEKDFEKHVDEVILRHPKEAALGGVPSIRNKIRAFVNVVLRSQESREAYKVETVNGSFVWAQAYYLVRCGHTDQALDLIAENQSHLSRDDWSFPGCFKLASQSPERRLSKSQKDQLYNDFNAHIRNNPTVDHYKAALYKIVGRFELNRKSAKVAATTEDWMWLQLNLLRENKEGDAPQEQYDLADLAKLLDKYGSDKFDAGGTKPLTWFNLLLFTAQFEKAVAYLYAKPHMRTDAVHFAIALAYYGLLRVPSRTEVTELLSISEPNGVASLHFSRLIKQYVAPFHELEPETALRYAYLVMLNSDAPPPVGPKQRQLSLDLVRDIVLSSRAWSKLLGSVRVDGSKEMGVVEKDLKLLKLDDEKDYLRQVVLAAAERSFVDASLADSIELFHLAGAYDKVIETVNRTLGHSLGQSSHPSLPTDAAQVGLSGAFGGAHDLYELAQKVHAVYEKDWRKKNSVESKNWHTLETLLTLKLGMSQFAADRPDLALETFKRTDLLPLDHDATTVMRYAQPFREILDQPVISNLDDVIVTTMKCLHLLSQQLKQSPYGDPGRMEQLQLYKHQAQCLIQFASTLRLRLGPDVYRQLSSMSAFF